MKNRQFWTLTGASVGIFLLILDGNTALAGAREGINLSIRTVIPSLFPFFVLSILITQSTTGTDLPVLRFLGKLFGLPKGAGSLLIPAFLGGYPVGAQSIASLHSRSLLSKTAAEKLLAFCNNAGPAFMFGMVRSMFPEKWMIWMLWGIHIGSAWLVSLSVPCEHNSCTIPHDQDITLSNALTAAIRVMVQVCGWVILFRIVIAFLCRWLFWFFPVAVQVALMGLLELSNGCCSLNLIENPDVRFMICSGILAFGGLCVTMQTVSVTNGLTLKYYFLGKGLQTVYSIFLSAAVVRNFWFLIPVLAMNFLLIPRKRRKNSRNPLLLGV